MVRLTVRRGPNVGSIYELDRDVLTIGRGTKNDIIIQDNEVSREHCRLIRVLDDYEVEDLNSSNGTFVNGQRVHRNWLLNTGALVELGDSITLEYERLDDREAPAAVEAVQETEVAETAPFEAAQQYALVMTAGPDEGHIYPLERASINLGRDLSNDIIIQDPEVSRFHLRLRQTPQGYELEDMGSTNGTVINDVLVTRKMLLHEDDMIRLGSSIHLQFVAQGVTPAPPRLAPESPTQTGRAPPPLPATANLETHVLFPAGPHKRRKTSSLGTGLEPGMLEDHIFLSYARDEWEDFVALLTVNLQDAGQKVWVDQYLAPGGADWRDAVEQALYECWMMVVVLSPRAVASHIVKMEYRYFINRDKPLVPFIYEKMVTMPVELARKQPILYNARDHAGSVGVLVDELKRLRDQRR